MRRMVVGLAVLSQLCLGALFAARADTTEVVGKSGGAGGHRWEWQGMASTKAAVGKPEGRLQVKVQNGDVVSFRVESGKHGVLFERAKKETGAGVWEAVGGSGELKEIPDTAGFKRFDRNDARTTDPKGAGSKLVEIKIKGLKGGAENGILFACNPHSTLGSPEDTTMLGVIVLAEGGGDKK